MKVNLEKKGIEHKMYHYNFSLGIELGKTFNKALLLGKIN